jgi:exodeoxyribonuclease VII large subunit
MEERTFTVSELTARVKSTLETQIKPCWVSGEISNLKLHSSGHIYFSLKDSEAQIRCVMFRSAAGRLTFQPVHGMQVRVFGNITVYEKQGDYQIRVEQMEPAGKGALNQAFEALKARLFAEGLFDESKKKKLPRFPGLIGIVTSETGAAIRDIVNIISRRYPIVKLLLFPAKVQGEGAAQDIVRGIRTFDLLPPDEKPDVLIVGRGGGSLEDLWAFNEEIVARAIAECSIPVISAVGHEIDFTISDFVADKRAPTPSAAAEMAVPDSATLRNSLYDMQNALYGEISRKIELFEFKLKSFESHPMLKPLILMEQYHMRLDNFEESLLHSLVNIVQSAKFGLQNLKTRILVRGPHTSIAKFSSRLQEISNNLAHGLDRFKFLFDMMNVRFCGFDPRGILRRGYAICSRKNGTIIKTYKEVKTGEKINVELGEGELDCRVEDRRFI